MTLTHLDLDRIDGLAKAATPGPWEVGLAGDYPRDSSLDADHTPIHSDTWGAFASVVTSMNGGGRVGTSEQGKANAAYIAALDPTTVTALITRIRELEGALQNVASTYAAEDYRDGSQERRLGDLARTALQRKTP